MATFSSVTRQHVLAAIAEHDTRGAEGFLALYGFPPSGGTLTHEGHAYDARAILGVAHRYATGRLATVEEFHGELHAIGLLRKRGFDVTEPPSAHRAAPRTTSSRATPSRSAPAGSARSAPRPRAPQTAARAAAARDAAPALCPTCSMALPTTGVCDYCA